MYIARRWQPMFGRRRSTASAYNLNPWSNYDADAAAQQALLARQYAQAAPRSYVDLGRGSSGQLDQIQRLAATEDMHPLDVQRALADEALQRQLALEYARQKHQIDMASLQHLIHQAQAASLWRAQIEEKKRQEDLAYHNERYKWAADPMFQAQLEAARQQNEQRKIQLEQLKRAAAPITPYERQSGITGLSKILRGESPDPFEAESAFRSFTPDQIKFLMAQKMIAQARQETLAQKAEPKPGSWVRDPLAVALAGIQKQLTNAAKPDSGAKWEKNKKGEKLYPIIKPDYAAVEEALQISRLPEIVALRRALGWQPGQIPTAEQIQKLKEFAPEYAWGTGKGLKFIQETLGNQQQTPESMLGPLAPTQKLNMAPPNPAAAEALKYREGMNFYPEPAQKQRSSAEDVLGPLALGTGAGTTQGGGLQFPGGWMSPDEAEALIKKNREDKELARVRDIQSSTPEPVASAGGDTGQQLSERWSLVPEQLAGLNKIDAAMPFAAPEDEEEKKQRELAMLRFFLPGMDFPEDAWG
jgi:hypothetical protein